MEDYGNLMGNITVLIYLIQIERQEEQEIPGPWYDRGIA